MVYTILMIHRTIDRERIQTALKRSRIGALLGPRQCGKTTLKLDELYVIYPGGKRYSLADKVTVVPLAEFAGAL